VTSRNMRWIGVVLTAFLCASTLFAAEPGRLLTQNEDAAKAIWEIAKQNGVPADRLRVDPAALDLELTYSGRFRLQSYVLREPSRAPGILEALAHDLTEGEGVAGRLELLAQLARPEGGSPGSPVLKPEETEKILGSSTPIQKAIDRIYDGTKKRFQGKELEMVTKDEAALPPTVAREVAVLLLAALDASLIRDAAVKESSFRKGGAFDSRSKKTAKQLREFMSGWWEDGGQPKGAFRNVEPALESLNLDRVYQGAIELSRVLDRSAGMFPSSDPAGVALVPAEFQFVWDTPRGRFGVGGTGDNEYQGHYSLILDFGGNDSYLGPGAVSGRNPVSVVLDLGGNDRYQPADSAMAAPGGAILGYAAIVDVGRGADIYSGIAWGGGFGFLGVGWIHDDGGNDTYLMQWLSQGVGLFGLGLLLDEGGDDERLVAGWNRDFPQGRSQGFGGPSGLGALIDLEGKDVYAVAAGDSVAAPSGGFVQGAASGVQTYRAVVSGFVGRLRAGSTGRLRWQRQLPSRAPRAGKRRQHGSWSFGGL
jgi:hypothetical protein